MFIDKNTPDDVRDLITSILKINPKERLTIDEILNHPFLKKEIKIKKFEFKKHSINFLRKNT